MQNDYVLGVDGGKSKTVCLLADSEGRLVGWGRAGNSDKYTVPIKQALDEVAVCVEQALEQGGIKPEQVAAGCFGLAGADSNRSLLAASDWLAQTGKRIFRN